jgi:hypothetical protein
MKRNPLLYKFVHFNESLILYKSGCYIAPLCLSPPSLPLSLPLSLTVCVWLYD